MEPNEIIAEIRASRHALAAKRDPRPAPEPEPLILRKETAMDRLLATSRTI